MDRAALKARVLEAIDRRGEEIVALGEYLLANAELGYRETKAAALVTDTFRKLGLPFRDGLAVTGARAELAGQRPGPAVAVLGELDGLVCHDHPTADPQGAAHTCGHNAQVAAMLGVGMALADSGAMAHLGGRVVLFAVPAEEFVEIEYRQRLRDAGTIEFLGGKQELVRLGAFDDVDMAMMIHSTANLPERKVRVGGSTNGFLAKTARFRGKASHAGARPDLGINALNAAALAIMGLNAQRETFRDEDAVRVHHIITRGGELVNVVPDDIRMELFVRGKSIDAIRDASAKVDRALHGGASMVGAEVLVEDLPGYLPLRPDPGMTTVFRDNAEALLGTANVVPAGHAAASTDMGDLSHLMPALHPFAGGFRGVNHGADFVVADKEMVYLVPAKLLAATVIDLLWDDAAAGRAIVQAFRPALTRAQYLAYLRGDARAQETHP